jgi:hypothetical protein
MGKQGRTLPPLRAVIAAGAVDGRRGTVVGESVVVLVDGRAEPGALVVRLARPGQSVDLDRRLVR